MQVPATTRTPVAPCVQMSGTPTTRGDRLRLNTQEQRGYAVEDAATPPPMHAQVSQPVHVAHISATEFGYSRSNASDDLQAPRSLADALSPYLLPQYPLDNAAKTPETTRP